MKPVTIAIVLVVAALMAAALPSSRAGAAPFDAPRPHDYTAPQPVVAAGLLGVPLDRPVRPPNQASPEAPYCLRGEVIARGFTLMVATPAISPDPLSNLELCARARQISHLYSLHNDRWVRFTVALGVDAPANRPFRELFPRGIRSGAPLLAYGQESSPEPFIGSFYHTSRCFSADHTPGNYGLARYLRRGDWNDLQACIEITFGTLGTVVDGRWEWYIRGRENAGFINAFRDGVPRTAVFLVQWASLVPPESDCLLGEIEAGTFGMVTYNRRGFFRDFDACLLSRNVSLAYFLVGTRWNTYEPETGRGFAALRDAFGRNGVPSLVPFVVRSVTSSPAPEPGQLSTEGREGLRFGTGAIGECFTPYIPARPEGEPLGGRLILWLVYSGGDSAHFNDCLESEVEGTLVLTFSGGAWVWRAQFADAFPNGAAPGTPFLYYVPLD